MNLKTIKGVKQIWIAIILVLTVAGSILIAQPFFMQNSKLAEDIKTSQEAKDAAQTKLTRMSGFKASVGAVEKLDNDLSTQFPGAAQTPELIAFVQKAASDAGLPVSAITDLTTTVPKLEAAAAPAGGAPAPAGGAAATPAAPADPAAAAPAGGGAAPPTSGGNLASMTVSIKAEGSVSQLQAFVVNLSSGSRNLLISGYSIDKGSSDKGGATLDIPDAKTFIYKTIAKPAVN